MPPIGIGLVGCGMIGQIHADGLAKLVEDGEIVAVAAADLSDESIAATQHNCAFARTSHDAASVIADPAVDAVMIATPTAAHRDAVLAAVEAGKAVFCEKPLAPTFDDVQELCSVVDASGLVARVGFHSRFHPILNKLEGIVLSGELGRPMGYALRDDQYWPTGSVVSGHSSWRSDRAVAGGGALLEHSIHSADILSWLFGAARSVYARTRRCFGFGVEDAAALTIEHDTGVVGNLVTIFNGVRGREERRLEVFFEQGTVELTTDFLIGAEEDSLLLALPDTPAAYVDLDELRSAHFDALGVTRPDLIFYPYLADRAWVQAISGARTPGAGFPEALRAHALVEAAYRSARLDRAVELGEVLGG
ncbi:MAG TPA: Gfo/Idh/MocA family oxidoreductase [Acidimicrobiia bacterium]